MMTEVKTGKLSDIKPTRNNSNRHTAKGMKALENALSEDGYVAPMTATADGEIIDGDARLHVAFDKFGDEALIVHHDGTKPIVMVRDDIPNADHPTARRIHYRANTIAWQNLDLDPSVIMADIESGFDFEKIDLSLPDLGELLGKGAGELLNNQLDPTPKELTSEFAILIEFETEEQQVRALREIEDLGYQCRALVS